MGYCDKPQQQCVLFRVQKYSHLCLVNSSQGAGGHLQQENDDDHEAVLQGCRGHSEGSGNVDTMNIIFTEHQRQHSVLHFLSLVLRFEDQLKVVCYPSLKILVLLITS